MNLQAMRDRYRAALGDRAGATTDPEVDAALNLVWQWELPALVDGPYREGTYSFDTEANVGDYTLPARVRSLDGEPFLSGDYHPLYYYDRPDWFWRDYKNDPGVERGKPVAVLYRGRVLTFRAVPNGVYTVECAATLFQNDPLTQNGLENGNEAQATVRGAVVNTAAELGYDDVFAKFDPLYQRSVGLVRRTSYARRTTPYPAAANRDL